MPAPSKQSGTIVRGATGRSTNAQSDRIRCPCSVGTQTRRSRRHVGTRMARSTRGTVHHILCCLPAMSGLAVSIVARAQIAAPPDASAGLSEIIVTAPEPRFVAPTRRDKIGRIWAPVMINGQGPFRLVLDTGASRSGITAQVADTLRIPPDTSRPVLLRGVTGSIAVPTIRVDSFAVGDVILTPATLPIVTDALGGAEGVLGTEGFADKRLYIDFKHDLITITHSRGERVRADFVVIPLERSFTGLLVIYTQVAGVRVQAIIDTGGQATIGNEAMRVALVRRHAQGTLTPVTDVTTTTQNGESFPSPPIEVGSIQIRGARITYGDMHIFEHWHMTKEPALLIGMDVLGLLDVFVIDYRRHELQLRTRTDQN
jgi:predicted aspartyl protease